MKIPVIRGVIARRILINYRVDPAVLAGLLPAPFRPNLIHGSGMVGICLIRLKHVRPRFLPGWLGINSDNAAHRAAVAWHENGVEREGVYVRRRDTGSWLNTLAGGRVFPGNHYHARFTVDETAERFRVALHSDDGETSLSVAARLADSLPKSSVFQSLAECSQFFAAGSLGYSPTPRAARFQGLELRCIGWQVEPLEVEAVRSSFFDDPRQFPPGSIAFDSAVLMRNIEHEWRGQPDLCCPAAESRERVAESPRA